MESLHGFRENDQQGRESKWSVHNRISAIMAHTTRYAFKGQVRLSRDARVSEAAISRLVNGCSHPSYRLVFAVTQALEKALGRPLSPNEVVSYSGSYPTPSVCRLAGCSGCMPDAAYDSDERLRPEFRGVKPGDWSLPGGVHSSNPLHASTINQKEEQ